MSETSETGWEIAPSEGYMRPTSYRVFAMCHRCGNEFHWIAKAPGGKDRPCPRKACRQAIHDEEVMEQAEKLAVMLAEQRAPAVIGNNNQVKAIDATAEIVMHDYQMTDLKTGIREGEGVAPKLPGALQAQADGYFGGRALADRGGARMAQQLNRIGKRAISGGLGPSPIDPGRLAAGGATVTPGQRILRPLNADAKPVRSTEVRRLGRG